MCEKITGETVHNFAIVVLAKRIKKRCQRGTLKIEEPPANNKQIGLLSEITIYCLVTKGFLVNSMKI